MSSVDRNGNVVSGMATELPEWSPERGKRMMEGMTPTIHDIVDEIHVLIMCDNLDQVDCIMHHCGSKTVEKIRQWMGGEFVLFMKPSIIRGMIKLGWECEQDLDFFFCRFPNPPSFCLDQLKAYFEDGLVNPFSQLRHYNRFAGARTDSFEAAVRFVMLGAMVEWTKKHGFPEGLDDGVRKEIDAEMKK